MYWPHPQTVTFSVPCSKVHFLLSESSHFGVPNHGYCPGAQQIFWHHVWESAKTFLYFSRVKLRQAAVSYYTSGWSGEQSFCVSAWNRNNLSWHFLSIPAVRAWAVFPQEAVSSLRQRACPLSPKLATLQLHQHKGKLPASTMFLQLKMSFTGPVAVLLYFMLKSCIEKRHDQTAHYISGLSTVSRLSAKISLIS